MRGTLVHVINKINNKKQKHAQPVPQYQFSIVTVGKYHHTVWMT